MTDRTSFFKWQPVTRRFVAILIFVSFSQFQPTARAQVFTWTGAQDNQFFAVPGNWSPVGIPSASSEIRFNSAPTAASGLRIFDGSSVASALVIDGANTILRPEGTFSTSFLRVGGTSTGASSSFSSMNLVNFNGNTRFVTSALDVGTFSSSLPGFGQTGNLQVGAGTEVIVNNSANIGNQGNNGFLSIVGAQMTINLVFNVGLSSNTQSASFGFVTVQGGSTLDVNGITTLGRILAAGATADATLEAGNNSTISLEDVTLGIGASGTIVSNNSVVSGLNFDLGRVASGTTGDGHLNAIFGGRITANSINLATSDSTIRAASNGEIITNSINMSDGMMFIEGGSIESGSVLTLQSGNLFLSSGLGNFRSLRSVGSGTIEWTGGDIRLRDEFTLINNGGLFNLNTVVPAAGRLILDNDVLILSEIQVDGEISAPRIYSFGDLILNDATVMGMTELSGSSRTFVDGVIEFVGIVTGRGQFIGADSIVRFLGRYEPGNDTEGAVSISFDGGVELASSSVLDLEIFGSEHGQYDQLDISGDLLISGDLEITCPNGFIPAPGDEFMIAEIDGITSGEFDSLSEGSVAANMGDVELAISYVGGDGNDVVLIAKSKSILLGDVNGDGLVNLLDIQPFVDLVSSGGYQAEADTNGDGLVNLLDVESFIELLSGA